MLVSNEVRIDTCTVQQALLVTPLQQENAALVAALQVIMGGNEQVRLMNGTRPWNGRVEVKYYNGTWGTVCDDSFSTSSAVVVCRMLGLTRQTPVVYSSAFYGAGSLPILLDDVTCLGNETNIFSCSHRPCVAPGYGLPEFIIWALIRTRYFLQKDRELKCHETTLFLSSSHCQTCVIFKYHFNRKRPLQDCVQFTTFIKKLRMNFAYGLVIIAVSTSVCNGYYWTRDSPTNGSVYHACVGDSITIPWAVVTSTFESVNDVEWYFSAVKTGGNMEHLASYINGDFFVSHSSRKRVSFVTNAGLRISDVTQEDFGDYIVHIVINSNSSFVTDSRYVSLHLPEPQAAVDRQLHARMLTSAVQVSGDWRVQLACSGFDSWGSLLFSVYWRTPSGRFVNSSISGLGEEMLTLTNPVEEGNYFCYLDIHDPMSRCVYDGPTFAVSNEVHVDNCSVQQTILRSSFEKQKAELQLVINRDSIRLVGGSRPWRGRVEVWYNGTWGTVCDDGFDVRSAVVICRMLQFHGETPVVHSSAHYGEGTLPILLDDVMCRGNETNILDCTHSPIGVSNCRHNEDAGIDCLPSISNFFKKATNGQNVQTYLCKAAQDFTESCSLACYCQTSAIYSTAIIQKAAAGLCTVQNLHKKLRMNFAYGLLIIAVSTSVCRGYYWTRDSPTNGSVYHACVGDSITIPWAVVTSTFESVNDVEWYFSAVKTGGNVEHLASYINGDFFVSHSSRKRVSFVTNAGLRISDVTQEDFGDYIVHIVINSNSSFVTDSRYVSLHLPDHESVVDRQLHARMLTSAVQVSRDWRVQLACSGFDSWGSLRFSVLWRTPSGRFVNSSISGFGEEMLTLTNPVEEGNYFCYLDIHDPMSRCAYDGPTFAVSNEVHVDNCSVQQTILRSSFEKQKAELQLVINRGSVRLVNGSRPWRGRVEVWYNETWGTVCDDYFSVPSAVVVCRMLQFHGETPVLQPNVLYGPGTLPILLDDVRCYGNETNILDCPHRPIGDNNCEHSEDIAVDCLPRIK
ncbi:uncharacterized protein LOC112561443 [Pomacea canaliculata]|uniref:uncharacterized protein LOC112561443 n=1 Tax=Pomacea canaliculata TaxID=400727 RepID=UPI000D72F8DE|nr:uncharacterized protein LOC112561443 [Pomacea canaliculata]